MVNALNDSTFLTVLLSIYYAFNIILSFDSERWDHLWVTRYILWWDDREICWLSHQMMYYDVGNQCIVIVQLMFAWLSLVILV